MTLWVLFFKKTKTIFNTHKYSGVPSDIIFTSWNFSISSNTKEKNQPFFIAAGLGTEEPHDILIQAVCPTTTIFAQDLA